MHRTSSRDAWHGADTPAKTPQPFFMPALPMLACNRYTPTAHRCADQRRLARANRCAYLAAIDPLSDTVPIPPVTSKPPSTTCRYRSLL